MQKMKDIYEVLDYLKQGEILTINGKDQYIILKDKINCFKDGTRFVLNENDFIKLYNKNSFYLYEETVEIDVDKDEAYYRYFKK